MKTAIVLYLATDLTNKILNSYKSNGVRDNVTRDHVI